MILTHICLRRSETPQRAISKKGWLPLFASQLIVKMKDSIKQILPLWELKEGELRQIYSSAWEVGDSYVIKVYSDKAQLERNIKISTILASCNIPVAEIVPTKTEEKYVEYRNAFFLLSKKLQGSNLVDFKDRETARKMGCAIARSEYLISVTF